MNDFLLRSVLLSKQNVSLSNGSHVSLARNSVSRRTNQLKSRKEICSAKLTSITLFFFLIYYMLDIFFSFIFFHHLTRQWHLYYRSLTRLAGITGEHPPFAAGCLGQIIASALIGLFKTFCTVYRHHQIPQPSALLTTLACPSVSTINGTICIFHCRLLSLYHALLVSLISEIGVEWVGSEE